MINKGKVLYILRTTRSVQKVKKDSHSRIHWTRSKKAHSGRLPLQFHKYRIRNIRVKPQKIKKHKKKHKGQASKIKII
jgi:hypothetical protein